MESLTKEKTPKRKVLAMPVITIVVLTALFVSCAVYWNVVSVLFTKLFQGKSLVKEFVLGLGVGGGVGIFTLVCLLYFFPVVSSLPLQVTAGISYGALLGSLLVAVALGLSAQIVFLFDKNIKLLNRSPKKVAARLEMKRKIENSGRNMAWVLILAYIVPGIPFVLIALVAVSGNLKWRTFTFITFFGQLFDVFTTIFLGNAVLESSETASGIILAVIIFIVTMSLIFKNKIVDFVFSPRKYNLEQELRRQRARLPSMFLYAVIYRIVKWFVVPRSKLEIFNRECVTKNKEQFVFVGNHPSRIDFLYTAVALYPRRINFLITHYEMYNKSLNRLLNALGTIPKYLYQPDPQAIRKVLKTKRIGGSIGIFPEGIISVSGAGKPVNPSTGKLVKQLGLRVVLAKTSGAYLVRPKFTKEQNRGKVEVRINEILSAEDVKSKTAEEIQLILREHLRYDEFDWAANTGITLKPSKHGLAHKLHNILYYCPHCKTEFNLVGEKNSLICTACGYSAELNEKMLFKQNDVFPFYYKTISEWYRAQEDLAAGLIKTDNFLLEDTVTLTVLDKIVKRNNPEIQVGNGKVWLDRTGFHFSGTKNSLPFELHVEARNMPSICFASGRYIEQYIDGEYYGFYLSRPIESVKWTICAERLFDDIEGTWVR